MTKNREETTGIELVWGIDPRAGGLETTFVPYTRNPRTGELSGPIRLGLSGRAGLQAQPSSMKEQTR